MLYICVFLQVLNNIRKSILSHLWPAMNKRLLYYSDSLFIVSVILKQKYQHLLFFKKKMHLIDLFDAFDKEPPPWTLT